MQGRKVEERRFEKILRESAQVPLLSDVKLAFRTGLLQYYPTCHTQHGGNMTHYFTATVVTPQRQLCQVWCGAQAVAHRHPWQKPPRLRQLGSLFPKLPGSQLASSGSWGAPSLAAPQQPTPLGGSSIAAGAREAPQKPR